MPDFTGEFEVLGETLRDMHEALVHILGPRPGERWLDVGCGVGNLAELAAGAGADVTGLELSPRLIEVARARAEAGGYDIAYRVGDPEHLDVQDAGVDVLVSALGPISASEAARVVRPGGRLGFTAWTPEGWGDERHVRDQLGGAFFLRADRRRSRFDEADREYLLITGIRR